MGAVFLHPYGSMCHPSISGPLRAFDEEDPWTRTNTMDYYRTGLIGRRAPSDRDLRSSDELTRLTGGLCPWLASRLVVSTESPGIRISSSDLRVGRKKRRGRGMEAGTGNQAARPKWGRCHSLTPWLGLCSYARPTRDQVWDEASWFLLDDSRIRQSFPAPAGRRGRGPQNHKHSRRMTALGAQEVRAKTKES